MFPSHHTHVPLTLRGGGGGGGGGGTQFPRELSPVNWFCTTRELGPARRIRSGPVGRKLDRTIYPTCMSTMSMTPETPVFAPLAGSFRRIPAISEKVSVVMKPS